MVVPPPLAVALAVLVAAAGCGRRPSGAEARAAVVSSSWPAPAAADRGAACADVRSLRVCWGEDRLPVSVAPRPVPGRPLPRAGWRCTGSGAGRACVDRAGLAGPFECQGATCVQRHPRLPDENPWECVDLDGAVVCRGGEVSSGVTAAAPDPGWICGRRGRDPAGAPVCVDLAPDLPDGADRGWRCRFDHAHGVRRLCTRDARAPAVGVACGGAGGAGAACPPGLACAAGLCVPRRPAASCWLDADCPDGERCRHGSCLGEARRP